MQMCVLLSMRAGVAWLLIDGHAFGLPQLLEPTPTGMDWSPILPIHPAKRAALVEATIQAEVTRLSAPHSAMQNEGKSKATVISTPPLYAGGAGGSDGERGRDARVEFMVGPE